MENNELLDEASEITDTSLIDYSDELENPMSSTTDIDELTLSLLMNKNHYRKYITQINPEQGELENQRITDNRIYRSRIMDLTSRLLDSPDLQINTDITEIFVAYTKRLIQYFKMQDRDNPNYNGQSHYSEDGYGYGGNNDNDNDVLFGNMDEDTSCDETYNRSFWGKERVIKKGSLSATNYDIRMFSKR